MIEYKLVFTGTTGAGKTTAISAISETAPISTDVANSDTGFQKSHTTVGLDFGQITLANGDRLRLFGTPGQSRFDFMWKILVKDAFGLIILIDNSRPDPLADLDLYLKGFSEEIYTTPCVIGIGRSESHPTPSLDDFSDKLCEYQLTLPILPVDVRLADDVIMLIDVLMAQAESDLK
ncbi:MAG: GTP-binding protein [Gammaproteobacteria bacterium]|nr:MAG: GTP-binding protein [Gammaproteobacteria bacterium]